MQILVALTIGLMIWVAGWALGFKSADAFLVPLTLVLLATAARFAGPFVRRQLGRD